MTLNAQETYPNAPIIEAVIDLQFAFQKLPRFDQIMQLAQQLEPGFDQQEQLVQHAFEHVIGAEVRSVSSPEPAFLGVKLSDKRKGRVLQLRRDGFTFSHLAPYSNWPTFKSECVPLLAAYIDALAPKSVRRAAVRYINKLTVVTDGELVNVGVSVGKVSTKDYFKLYPEVPSFTCNVADNFQMTLHMPQTDIDASAILGLATLVEPGGLSYLFDIDVYKQCNDDPQLNRVLGTLDALRERKNELFEGSITDKTRDLMRSQSGERE